MKMTWLKWLIILGSLANGSLSSVNCQTTDFLLFGTIVNETTLKPISGVAIWDKLNQSGTVTNDLGAFSLKIKAFPVILTIRQMGYFEDSIRITSQSQYKKSFEGKALRITLRENPFLINEVVISPDNEPNKVIGEEPFAVMDYVIRGDRFYALGYRNYNPLKPELLLGNPFGRLIDYYPCPKAQEIFEDCQGVVYISTRDSAYRFINNHDTISLLAQCDFDFFNRHVKPIVDITDPWFIWVEKSSYRQITEYFLGNYISNKNQLLYRVGNSGRENALINTHETLKQEFISEINRADISGGELRIMHARQALLRNKINTDFRPVKSAYVPLQDSALLLDFELLQILCITGNGNLKWQTPILINLSKDFTGTLHHDPTTNRFFLEFHHIQSTYLMEINPRSGTAVATFPIKPFQHIENIQIQDNRVFFLYQPDIGDKGKKLYFISL